MTQELAEADPKNQIVITLHETDGKRLHVRAVEMFIAPMRMRLSTTQADTLDSVFHRDIADTLRRICDAATMAKQIINVPDFVLRFRGLAIRGYTLLVHTMEDGVRQFIVRLKRGVGNALALFRSWDSNEAGLSILPTNGTNRQIDSGQLFDEMLSHLYLPLINLNNYLRQSLDGRQDMQGTGIGSSVVQLKTKAEVLQFAFDRLISEMMLEKYAGGNEGATVELTPIPPHVDASDSQRSLRPAG